MSEARNNKYITLPVYEQTEVVGPAEDGAKLVRFRLHGKIHEYYIRPILDPNSKKRRDGKSKARATVLYMHPVVLKPNGSIAEEPSIFITDCSQAEVDPRAQKKYKNKAMDLGHYWAYLEEEELDWWRFDEGKLWRPTYKFLAHLQTAYGAQELGWSTANRILGTMTQFYMNAMDNNFFEPEYQPFLVSKARVSFVGSAGQIGSKAITKTDMKLKGRRKKSPYARSITDGQTLIPLLEQEQVAMLSALDKLGNTEMTSIIEIMLSAGARTQTALTLKYKHFSVSPEDVEGGFFAINVGPGTGVDTKNNKSAILILPLWLYEKIYIYLRSERYKHRCMKSPMGMSDDQYVFLSQRGSPHYDDYESLGQRKGLESAGGKRDAKQGHGLRIFIKKRLLPMMRAKLEKLKFNFTPHDLRATFGVNVLRFYEPLVNEGKLTHGEVLDLLKDLMWHEDIEVTKRYVKYHRNYSDERQANDVYFEHLKCLIARARGG